MISPENKVRLACLAILFGIFFYTSHTSEKQTPPEISTTDVQEMSVKRENKDITDTNIVENTNVTVSAGKNNAEVDFEQLVNDTIYLVNEKRLAYDLKPLKVDVNLIEPAAIRAKEASEKWSHTRPDGSEWYTVNPDIMYGENLAYGYNTADEVVEGWMNSKEHRANILAKDFETIAIAIFVSNDGTYYWAEEFGMM